MNYRANFTSAPVGIFRIGPDGTLIDANESMAKICGYESARQMLADAAGLEGKNFVGARQWNDIVGLLPSTGLQCGIESEVFARYGDRKWVQMNVWAVPERGAIIHYEGTAEDITSRKFAAHKMKLLASIDPATGLPNRSRFEERLSHSIAAAARKKRRAAVLLLEFSRLNWVNDSFGRAVGDALLEMIAAHIQRVVEPSVTVARIEGGRFAILLENVRWGRVVRNTARALLTELSAQITVFGHAFTLPLAMGIGIFPADAGDERTLLSRATQALYSAKEAGCNEIRFFSEDIEHRFRERLRIETGLMLALERREFSLVYQPQVDTETGCILGLEALLRWEHPELGTIPSSEFFAVAESSRLIVPIGEWVLRTACQQTRNWQDAGLPAIPVAINVSAVQLQHGGFDRLVRQVVEETGVAPKYVKLQLTEGSQLKDVEVLAALGDLRKGGVRLTIDDVRSDSSRFNDLRQFKANRLKTDPSIVREVTRNPDDAAITRTILNMARALHLDALAEGVENAQQLDFLRMLELP